MSTNTFNENVRGFKVGSRASFEHTVTAEEVKKFAEMTGDNNPLHLDHQFAERTSFRGVIAHGMFGASFFSTIIGKHIPGDGALWLSQSIEFLLPVRIGDVLTIVAEVTGINVGQQLLFLKTEIYNQHKQLVVTGEAKAKALSIEPAPDTIQASDPTQLKHTVIVTGASKGIGASTAKMLAEKGHRVVINFHSDEERARNLEKSINDNGGRAISVKADISNSHEIKRLIKATIDHFGELTAVVNCATPKLIYKGFENTTIEDFEKYFKVIFYGAQDIIRQSLPYLEESKRGSVVNIGTIATDNVPAVQLSAYTCAKAALLSLTKSLAVEFGHKNVRFNIVSPGMTETSLIADTPERARMLVKMQTPLRRLATPDDIAHGICFLLDPLSRHITGENLRICGGTIML